MRPRQFILILAIFGKAFCAFARETNPPVPAVSFATDEPTLKFEVRDYRLEGETFLPPEKLSSVLSNYTGMVDLPCVHAGLNRLQRVYESLGITNVSVTLPQQTLADGIVLVKIVPRIVENVPSVAPKPAPKLEVRAYRIEGNTVLPPENFGVLSNYTGTNLDFPRLREGLGKLQMRYRELGFPTINVTLPQQKLTNGVVRVQVVEGRLSEIVVSGNKHFSSENIRRALPSLTTNILLNTKWFQPELDEANASRDRQIYPVISPGLDPGTTRLELKVKDRLPLHGRIEVNDKSTPGTPLLRLDTAVQYGNLWQREHQIGVDYNFSPQRFKGGGDAETFLDSPEIASYSAFYRLPLGSPRGRREDLDQQPVTFGYDEVSHKFNLPPPSGHPDLALYASHSSSATLLQSGPLTTIFTNTLADIRSQFVQRSATVNNNVGAKLTLPLKDFLGIKSSLLLGVDFKTYDAKTYSTNQTFFDLYALDEFGNRVLVTNQTVSLQANKSQSLYYLPLSIGWIAARPDQYGSFVFNWNQNIFLTPLASSRKDFQGVAGSTQAGGNYTTINAGLVRQQKLFGEWSATLNVNGQWASAPLISNEQFGLGGTAGVRGYQEGAAYGDCGWRALFDLRAPSVNIGFFPTDAGDVPAQLRTSFFTDYGQIYSLSQSGSLNEWGTGVAFLLTIGAHIDARLTLAWALENAPTTTAGNAQAYFTVGAQF
jgi:hemolysin activation/secretion protein